MFEDPWATHPLLTEGVGEILDFLKSPGTDSILSLASFSGGILRYRGTGTVVAQLLGTPYGEKAGLQLFARGCTALADALEAADAVGLPSHGDLSPWRLLIQKGGAVRLLGFGVPPVEALAWLDEEVDSAAVDALRFFPPERLEDRGEDGRSDLFALALIAAELATGKPVLSGSLNAVLDTIYDGKVADALEAIGGDLSDEAIELLCSAAENRIGDRPRDLRSLASEAAAAAASAPGAALDSLVREPATDDEDEPTDAPPESAQTDVVDLADALPERAAFVEDAATEMVDVAGLEMSVRTAPVRQTDEDGESDIERVEEDDGADTLLVAQGKVPPLRPVDEEPEMTEIGPLSTEDTPLPPPVHDLPADADLPAVRQHATALVTRAELLAALSGRAVDALRSADGVSAADRAAGIDLAERARKAATTARSSSSLLELDEDVDGARITLALITRAEEQAEAAAVKVQAMASEVVRRGRAARAAREAQERAEAAAEKHADAAATAAEKADAAVRTLDAERERGQLANEQALATLRKAWKACEAADDAAGQADEALAALREGEGQAVTLEKSRAAVQAAERALAEARRLIELARQQERDGAAQVAEEAASEAERAGDAVKSAQAAVERAQQAAEHIQGDASAKEAVLRAAKALKQAQAQVARAAVAAKKAKDSSSSAATNQALEEARAAADAAEAAAAEGRAAADEVARKAGAAAERAARIASVREQAGTQLAQLRRIVAKYREILTETRKRLEPVRSPRAHGAVDEAEASVDAFEKALDGFDRDAASLEDDAGLAELVRKAVDARESMEVDELLAEADREAREELAALEAERARAAALAEARSDARDHAAHCKELTDTANTALKTRISKLRKLGIPEIDERCSRADEILDIAIFQAGEAAQSAQYAAEEGDPEEAAAHAETAASFAGRIGLDLPEAYTLIEEAEGIADELRAARDQARNAARAIGEEAKAAVERAARLASDAREQARGIGDPGIERSRSMLDEALQDAEAARDKALSAAEDVQGAAGPEEAERLLDVAREAAGRLSGIEANVQDRADALIRVAASAREKQAAIEQAQDRASGWAQQAVQARNSATEAAEAADLARAENRAEGPGVLEAVAEAQRAAKEAEKAASAAREAAGRAKLAEDVSSAESSASEVREALEQAERARDVAIEAARKGEEAARSERRRREAAQERKLQAARDLAETHAETATEAVERLTARRDEVLAQLEGVTSAVARAEVEAAAGAAKASASAADAAVKARDMALKTDDPSIAEAAAHKAEAAAAKAQKEATRAAELLQSAQDHARAAAREADALAQVVAEANRTVGRAEDAVERAKEEAKAILQLKIGLDAKKELATAAREEITGAERALIKVGKTAPMAANAADLATAQALLATCRATVARAEERADAVRELVAKASRAVAEEAERRAAALTAARDAAREPADRARDFASQAKSWLEAARRSAGEVPGAKTALAALEKQAAKLADLAEQAARHVEGIDEVDDTAVLKRTSEKVVEGLTDLERAFEIAQRARDAIEAAEEAEAERLVRVRQAVEQVSVIREHAQEVVSRARAVVEELETWMSGKDDPGDVARSMLKDAVAAAESSRKSIDNLDALISQPPDSPDEIASGADRQMRKAIAGLEAVIGCDAACREAAAAYQNEKAERVRQAAEAKREAEAEEAKRKKTRAIKKADSREAKRQARLERRRERFMERRGLTTDSSGPIEKPDESDNEERRVRKWDRSKTSATKSTARPKRRPRPATRPEPAAPAESPGGGERRRTSGADALLERLRARQNRRDGD